MILILTEVGSRVGIRNNIIEVKKDDLVTKIPKNIVESVSIFGKIEISSKFIEHCLMENIPVMFFSYTGKYYGRLSSQSGQNLDYLNAQIKAINNEEYRRDFASNILRAKINNQVVVLRRYNKYKILDSNINFMKNMEKKINNKLDINTIIGYEGASAREYFNGISKILPKDFKFKGRNKRPPKDPFNSMISLGYTILLHEMIGELEAVGLSAYGGIIHGNSRHYPSLASDLIEEYRPIIVDSLVISLLKNKKVFIDEFNITDNGVFLSNELLKMYLQEVQKKMMSKHKYLSYLENKVTYRESIYHQCKRLRRSIVELDPNIYERIRIR